MNHPLRNRALIGAAGLLALLTLSACVATGYGDGGGIGGRDHDAIAPNSAVISIVSKL